MKIPRIAINPILGIVALACASSAAPGATVAIPATSTPTALPTPAGSPTPTVVVPTLEEQDTGTSESSAVEDLTKRVEDVLALASEGNWLEAREYYTLSFRESCPKEAFAAQASG